MTNLLHLLYAICFISHFLYILIPMYLKRKNSYSATQWYNYNFQTHLCLLWGFLTLAALKASLFLIFLPDLCNFQLPSKTSFLVLSFFPPSTHIRSIWMRFGKNQLAVWTFSPSIFSLMWDSDDIFSLPATKKIEVSQSKSNATLLGLKMISPWDPWKNLINQICIQVCEI